MTTKAAHLHLAPSGSCWTLIDDRREVVFVAWGPDARRRCLVEANRAGVLSLSFDEDIARGRP